MPQTNVLADLLDSLHLLVSSPRATGDELRSLLEEWKTFFQATTIIDTSPEHIATWESRLSSVLAKPDRQGQLQLIKEASEDPLLGLTLVVAALPRFAKQQVQTWWNMLFAEQSITGGLNGWQLKSLPAPKIGTPGTPGTKYLIFSDVHRDAASDDKGILAKGSIDHFKANAALYGHILDYAIDKKYTVLEAGDCEELWFIGNVQDYPKKPDGTLDVARKLSDIITSHPDIYEKLRQLHRQGRYFRVQGNHDSFLKKVGNDDSVGQVLRNKMESRTQSEIDRNEPIIDFVIYDACVIDGVKTMTEQSLIDFLKDAVKLITLQITKEQFVEQLLRGRLGLDSNVYTDKCKMVVAHGHQFDFWNCSNNEILGMLIANTVGTYVDRLMDPFLDARGIAWEGSPSIDFGDIFAALPVFNSWPDEQAAVRFAHNVQHSPNSKRVLNDNPMYYESVPALYGGFGIALNYHRDGREITPADSRQELNLKTPSGIAEYLMRHHFHHICIGHTHAPHSQPYFTIQNFGNLILPLAPVMLLLRLIVPDFLEPMIKMPYFNSGTVGWMEGVVWAIEIDETGQARLVYWTNNTIGPQYMDWELQPLPQEIRNKLIEGMTNAFNSPSGTVVQSVKDIFARLKHRLAELNVSDKAVKNALARATILPVHVLALALMTPSKDYATKKILNRHWKLEEVFDELKKKTEQTMDEAINKLEKQCEELRNFTLDVFLSIKRRALSGFENDSETEILSIRAPISPSGVARLERLKQIFKLMRQEESEALRNAALAFPIFEQFPRNMPFFSTLVEPLDAAARIRSSDAPVLQAFLSTLWMYPGPGQVVEIQGVAMESRFAVSGNIAFLTISLKKARPVVA